MRRFSERLWEILPGLATWLTLFALIWLTFYKPVALTIIILFYAIYFLLFRVLVMTGHLVVGSVRYHREQKINWEEKLKLEFSKNWRQYYHLVIIPTYKEDISILRHTLNAIAESKYPAKNLLVVVAFESRETKLAPEYAPLLTHEYEHKFGMFLTTFHPSDIPGEVRGKGPNITWAARQAQKEIDKRRLAYDKIITTTLDADNRVDKNYFANLSWNYLSVPDPVHKSFQPIPMFFNNIWQVPLGVKMTALGSSFWQLIQAMRPYYLRNFSAHAQSFEALVETDFWSVTTIVEDGHQYWRSFFAFNGNHHVVPLFVPIYMDAVQGEDLSDTFHEQYLQRRRWYWGVSDIPYVFTHSFGNNKLPFFYKWAQFARLVESHYSLATQSFILIFGSLPIFFHPSLSSTVLGYNFPIVYRALLGAAWIGMITNMTIASLLVPPRNGSRWAYGLTLAKEWVLAPLIFPLTGIFFSALPAVDSQTRLMINKPFTVFNVTKKAAIPSGILVNSAPK